MRNPSPRDDPLPCNQHLHFQSSEHQPVDVMLKLILDDFVPFWIFSFISLFIKLNYSLLRCPFKT